MSACSSPQAPAAPHDSGPTACAEGTPGCIGWVNCPPEFEKDGDSSCREIVPAGDCAPGTMPLLGRRECVPVGPACASGFETDPSGWGCRAVVPPTACEGATRDAIGSATCIAVGDCNAPFPPPDALVVNGAFTDGELGPKKFKTIRTAINAARAGDTVAIETGEYAEGIVARSSVTVVGRCPEKVRLIGTGRDAHGVLAKGSTNALVKGVTLVDHYEGARAMAGGTLTLEDVVIESARFAGLIAWQPSSAIRAERVVVRNVRPHATQTTPVTSVQADGGGRIELVDTAISKSWEAGLVAMNSNAASTPSKIAMRRSVIRDTNLEEHLPTGAGIVVAGVSRGEIVESAILDSRRLGALALFSGSELTIKRSEIRRTLDDASEEISAGVLADGGKISLEGVSVHEVLHGGVVARSKGTITAKDTVVHGTTPDTDGVFGMGAWTDSGAKLVVENTALVDNAYYGVSVIGASSSASLKNVLIRGTAEQKTFDGGLLGRGVNIEEGAAVDLDGVSIVANDGEGLFVRGETKEGERSRATATRLIVADGRAFDGAGIFIAQGALAEVDGALVRAAQRAGVIVNETKGQRGSRSEAALTHVVIRGTKRSGRSSADMEGTVVDGFGIGSAGKLVVRSSAIVDNVQFGAIIASYNDLASFENTVIASTKPHEDGSFGLGLVALGYANLIVRDTEIAANKVGLLFDGAAGVLAGLRIRGNGVAIHTQRGTTLVSAAHAPELPEPQVVFVTEDSQFIDNETRVGGGEIPLPANPFAWQASK